MKKHLLSVLLTLSSFVLLAQNNVKGRVVDAETGEALVGATVLVKGTITGTITDLNGGFSLYADSDATLQVSYIGFGTVEVKANSDLSQIEMKASEVGLSEIVVLASVATDRKTPVAVSTIKKAYIEANASNQEFPELLKTTPGVYATKQGGGYGDSRINVRGFNSVNVAVMINGIPVNDMENGRVFWSNWAGLTDVTSSMQVQRGLGASKVAVPSIGGTINILTKTTDAEKGGSFYVGTGNNGYQKTGVSLSTGLTENDWAISLAAARIEGQGWADGTQFLGFNYFFNVSKLINENHTLSLTGFGAPQRHGQRQNKQSIETFRSASQGIKYNADWGYKNGQIVNVEDNFYHKPQFSLNHYWTINENSELSTAAYMSFGTGGGGGTGGNVADFKTAGPYPQYDLDAAIADNQNSTDGSANSYLRASRNDHKWYGMLSTYTNQINSNFNFLAGLDLRYYKGIHFREVTDLLGAEYVLRNDDVNNPNQAVRVGDKYSYFNDGIVLWEGGFVQGEYTNGDLAAFASFSASNTSYKRIDYFQYTPDNQETEYQNFFGYQAKGGVNYNLTQNHNVFVNGGYFEKAPDFDAVFQNFANDINEDAENQKILSMELGYGYRSSTFTANLNVYRTQWMDRTFTKSFQQQGEEQSFFANILGVNALHQGLEFDFLYQPIKSLRVQGMASFGDWTWQDNVDGVTVFDEEQNEVGTIATLYISGLKVGDAAQTTGAILIDYDLVSEFSVGLTVNHYSNLFAEYDPLDRDNEATAGVQAWEVPTYNLVDFRAKYDFKIGNLDASVYGNVQNLFDVEYISDAQDGDSNDDGIGDAQGAAVFFGLGRTWTTGLKVKF